MPLASIAVIGATILVSSFISGTFGMAGGMVLLGVILIYFPVATGMVLFSIIQFVSNGWRALLRFIAYVPDKATVYILLGLLPFAVELMPAGARPNIEWRGVPLITGFFT